MIPTFPEFGPVPPDGGREIAALTACAARNSDFSHLSLWSWAIERRTRLSNLNGNLVVRFENAIDRVTSYTFAGSNSLDLSADKILSFAASCGHDDTLRTVPEEVAALLSPKYFRMDEEVNHADYLYSAESLSTLDGARHGSTRRLVNRFKRDPAGSVEWLDPSRGAIAREIAEVAIRWRANKEQQGRAPAPTPWGIDDLPALRRFLLCPHLFTTIAVGVRLENALVAFLIAEAYESVAFCHFAKADSRRLAGAYVVALQALAERLSRDGCSTVNYQEDLGVPSLRAAKEHLRPVGYARKFSVSRARA